MQLNKGDDGFTLTELWTTKSIARNYNLPVTHDGFIYGHQGRFLTCVNAVNGETAWKSRQPGDGWIILVGDHLVVLTKKGSLHLAEATPQGYREKTRMQLFDKLVWTPPAFAGQTIFARDSFHEIAAVDILSGKTTSDEPRVITPEDTASSFARFIEKLEGASDKDALIEEFLGNQKRFPIYEGDNLVHIVYTGQDQDMALRGDMYESGEEVPMKRVEGTGFHYASFRFEADAILSYRLVKNLTNVILDPRNPDKGPLIRGETSLIRIGQKSSRATHFEALAEGTRGTLEKLPFNSPKQTVGRKIWGGDRELQVYLPPGYHDGNGRYPVLYVHHGDHAVNHSGMVNTLDRLIGSSVQPVIAVFHSIHQPLRICPLTAFRLLRYDGEPAHTCH